VSLFLLSAPFTGIFASVETNGAIKSLQSQINAWSLTQFDNEDAYRFFIEDRRLKVPKCKQFVFSTSASFSKPISNFMLKASCPEHKWSRFIRAKSQNIVIPEVTMVEVLSPMQTIEAGTEVSIDDFRITLLPPNRAPQGSISGLDEEILWYAQRRLRSGHLVTEGDLTQPKKVLVVKRAIPAGSLLTTKDVGFEQRAANIPGDAITNMGSLSDLAANKLLHPGKILRQRDLTKGKLIKRGEMVALLSQGLSFAISSEVVALEDGFLGEQVRLINPESQRRVSAIVTGASQAKTLSSNGK
jgi:flagella basal body P-ring formation protein FlgA